MRKARESASSLWLLSVVCCSIIKHSHDSNRAISCERGVAIVANCAYPLRYLASRFSLWCSAPARRPSSSSGIAPRASTILSNLLLLLLRRRRPGTCSTPWRIDKPQTLPQAAASPAHSAACSGSPPAPLRSSSSPPPPPAPPPPSLLPPEGGREGGREIFDELAFPCSVVVCPVLCRVLGLLSTSHPAPLSHQSSRYPFLCFIRLTTHTHTHAHAHARTHTHTQHIAGGEEEGAGGGGYYWESTKCERESKRVVRQ